MSAASVTGSNCGASMATGGWSDKFQATIELCLQLALIGLNSGYAVRVLPFGESVASEGAINVIHPRQLLGSLRQRLAGLEPAGPTNFDALGQASLDWRNQGAMVVVLTDLLQDVDDDALKAVLLAALLVELHRQAWVGHKCLDAPELVGDRRQQRYQRELLLALFGRSII